MIVSIRLLIHLFLLIYFLLLFVLPQLNVYTFFFLLSLYIFLLPFFKPFDKKKCEQKLTSRNCILVYCCCSSTRKNHHTILARSDVCNVYWTKCNKIFCVAFRCPENKMRTRKKTDGKKERKRRKKKSKQTTTTMRRMKKKQNKNKMHGTRFSCSDTEGKRNVLRNAKDELRDKTKRKLMQIYPLVEAVFYISFSNKLNASIIRIFGLIFSLYIHERFSILHINLLVSQLFCLRYSCTRVFCE